jgi:histone H3/H4
MAEISSAPVKRLMVEASGGMRIGASALNLAVEATEAYVRRLAESATEHAKADRRKTIQDADIARARAELDGAIGGASPGGHTPGPAF